MARAWVVGMVLAGGMVLGGCASGGSKAASCAPVPVERRGGLQTVYAECDVDVKASVMPPAPRLDYTPGSADRCGSAQVEFVIDTAGKVIQSTITVVQSTNKAFADAVANSMLNARFTPARRQGVVVAQLYRHGSAFSSSVVAVPAGGRPSLPSQAGRRGPAGPRC